MRRVAIFTERAGWHGARLRRALRARGVQGVYVRYGECGVDLASPSGLTLPGFGRALPDGALVRAIPAGSFEQVTLRLTVLHTLAELGVPVWNSAAAIERSIDKARTSLLLARAGLPTPPTWVSESPAAARRVLLREHAAGHEVVAKPLFGSQGHGLLRLRAGEALPPGECLQGVWYLQRFVPAIGGARAWRLFVAGGRVVAGMLRHGRGWIANVAQGARCEAVVVDADMARLAIAACAAVGAGYAGVDLMREPGGAATVIEVNSIPSWDGLQSVTRTDVAQALVDAFLATAARPALEQAC